MKSLKKLLRRKGYIRIPLKKIKTNHLQVKAMINGVKGRFILDTGASNSCVGIAYIGYFNLEATVSEEKAAGAGTTDMDTQQSVDNLLQIGAWSSNTCHLVLFDLVHVNRALIQQKAKKVHGIIGADILQKGKGIIEYKEHVLYLKKAKEK